MTPVSGRRSRRCHGHANCGTWRGILGRMTPVSSVRLHHFALGAADPDRVAAFYRDLLGLREIARHREADGNLRSVWLDLGGPVLMVERSCGPPRRVEGVGPGPFLLALAADPARREALERSLAESGFPVESRTAHTIYFRDPEGNRVAASGYPFEHP